MTIKQHILNERQKYMNGLAAIEGEIEKHRQEINRLTAIKLQTEGGIMMLDKQMQAIPEAALGIEFEDKNIDNKKP